MRNNINPNFVSVFAYHVVYKTVTGCLAATSSLSLSKTFYLIHKGELKPEIAYAVACPLLVVISDLENMQLEQPIVDRASLKLAMQGMRSLFGFADASDECLAVKEEAKMFLEHVLAIAHTEGLAALDEALAGFPVSGGDLALWAEHRLTSASQKAMAKSWPTGALK